MSEGEHPLLLNSSDGPTEDQRQTPTAEVKEEGQHPSGKFSSNLEEEDGTVEAVDSEEWRQKGNTQSGEELLARKNYQTDVNADPHLIADICSQLNISPEQLLQSLEHSLGAGAEGDESVDDDDEADDQQHYSPRYHHPLPRGATPVEVRLEGQRGGDQAMTDAEEAFHRSRSPRLTIRQPPSNSSITSEQLRSNSVISNQSRSKSNSVTSNQSRSASPSVFSGGSSQVFSSSSSRVFRHDHPGGLKREGGGRRRGRKSVSMVAPGKKVMFNDLQEVVVYELESEVFITIHYQRNKIGWLFLLLAVAADVWASAHITYFAAVDQKPLSVLAFWGAVYKLGYYVTFMAVAFAAGVIRWPEFSRNVFNKDVYKWTIPWGIVACASYVGQVALAHIELDSLHRPPQFYPTINLMLIWMFLWRKLKDRPIFVQEGVGAAVAFIGFSISSWQCYSQLKGAAETCWINCWVLMLSFTFAAYYLYTEKVIHYSPSFSLTLLPLVLVDFLGALLLLAGFNVWDEVSSLAEEPIYGLIVGVEVFAVQFLYLVSATYLDVMSLAAGTAAKVVIMPMVVHFFVYSQVLERLQGAVTSFPIGSQSHELAVLQYNAVKKATDTQWNLYTWIGGPIVIIGCLVLVIFASVKRQFLARRLAWEPPMRRPRNPYNKKGVPIPSNSRQ